MCQTRPHRDRSSRKQCIRGFSVFLVARFEIGHTRRKFPALPAATSRFNAYLADAPVICHSIRPVQSRKYYYIYKYIICQAFFSWFFKIFQSFFRWNAQKDFLTLPRVFPAKNRVFYPLHPPVCSLFPIVSRFSPLRVFPFLSFSSLPCVSLSRGFHIAVCFFSLSFFSQKSLSFPFITVPCVPDLCQILPRLIKPDLLSAKGILGGCPKLTVVLFSGL